MAIIDKKINEEYLKPIESGEKTHEVRVADFPLSTGDILRLSFKSEFGIIKKLDFRVLDFSYIPGDVLKDSTNYGQILAVADKHYTRIRIYCGGLYNIKLNRPL